MRSSPSEIMAPSRIQLREYERVPGCRRGPTRETSMCASDVRSVSASGWTLAGTRSDTWSSRPRQPVATSSCSVAASHQRLASAALEQREVSPERYHIDVLAPASGRVLRVLQESAGLVQAGTPLLEVGDPAALEIVVDLLTTDAVHVMPGTPAQIVGWGGDHELGARRVGDARGFSA